MVKILNPIKNEEELNNMNIEPPKNKSHIEHHKIDWEKVSKNAETFIEDHKDLIKNT